MRKHFERNFRMFFCFAMGMNNTSFSLLKNDIIILEITCMGVIY